MERLYSNRGGSLSVSYTHLDVYKRQVLTIVGTKLAAKDADKEHPFGHGRIEYMTTMAIAFIILGAGLGSLKESIEKIIHPEVSTFDVPSLAIIAVAIVVKVEMCIRDRGATRHCSICFNLSAQDPCEFCSNPNRDQTTIMVVETSRDVIAIERSGDYKGLYHVLEGALSPMEGIGADAVSYTHLDVYKRQVCRSMPRSYSYISSNST